MASTTVQAKPGSQYHVVAYNTSKAALNSYTVALASVWPEAKINAVTPGTLLSQLPPSDSVLGYTSTKLNGFGQGAKTTAQGAAVITKYAVVDQDGPTGTKLK